MKHFSIFLFLCCIRDSALTTIGPTTEPTKLGCYEELQQGEYPEEPIGPNDRTVVSKIRNNCTLPSDHFVQQLRPARVDPEDPVNYAYDLVSNYTLWEDFCLKGQEVIDCINSHQPHCSDSFGPWYFREGEAYFIGSSTGILLATFHTRTCTGKNVKESLQTILNEKPDWNCIDSDAIAEKCVKAWVGEGDDNDQEFLYQPLEKMHRTKLSAAILRCALDLLAESSCSETQQELYYQATKILLPWTVDVDKLDPSNSEGIDYSQIRRCTAGVYGDPHIRLCDANSLITCSSPGTQVYYSGPLLEMTGINTRVRTTEATTLTNIDIKFYSESRSLVGRYQAGDSQLPSTLVGGQSSAGTTRGELKVVTVSADYEVNLIYRPLGLKINLRRWDENYFFTMRAAKALFSAGSGLLVTGCPTSERLNILRENRVRRGVTDANCENACDAVLQTEFYEACFFDCKTMRSLEAAQMTKQAGEMEDEVKLNDTELRRTAITINDISSSTLRTTNTASMFGFSLLGITFTLVVSTCSPV